MQVSELMALAFSANSVWSIVLRGAIWFAIAFAIIISTDNPRPERSMKNLKSNLGFLLLFLVLSSGLIFLLFGYMVV